MSVLHILDLVIGISFVYFLLSIICVALQEIKARWRNERSENLRKWIYDTFNTDKTNGLATRLWNNIIIDGLTQENKSASYIPKEIFVSALLDEIHYGSNDLEERKSYRENNAKLNAATIESLPEPFDFQTIRQSIEKSELLPLRMKRVLRQIHTESYGNLESFRDRLERWYDQAMDRNAGTFKKNAQKSVLAFSFLVTICLNVDSIKLIHYFYNSPIEAARVADAAEKLVDNPETAQRLKSNDDATVKMELKQIKDNISQIKDLKLPIGWEGVTWKSFFCEYGWRDVSLLGWLITIFAVSLGAPFWYDILNKLVDLRSAGKKPSSTPAAHAEAGKSSTETPIG